MTAFAELRQRVWQANRGIVDAGLVVLTWGNASGVDRAAGVMAIKPSGVDYDELSADDIVLVSLESGETVEGNLKPSSDTPTHLHLYRAFSSVGGIVHTHSRFAVSFAQAEREIPCLGTTHADHFYGTIPVTRRMREDEIRDAYEENTGRVIVEHLSNGRIDPAQMPAVLVAGHGPFTWGGSPEAAVANAIALEAVAEMAINTFALNSAARSIDDALLDKHYLRKHGSSAYYGQSH